MDAIRTIFKAAFLGAFFFGCGGGLVGGLAGQFIWPTSNLGPPAGALEGGFIGVALGVLAGFIYGVVQVSSGKRKAAEDFRNENADH